MVVVRFPTGSRLIKFFKPIDQENLTKFAKLENCKKMGAKWELDFTRAYSM